MLSKSNRIGRKNFKTLQNGGRVYSGRFFSVRIGRLMDHKSFKASVVVSKKGAKNATKRNRIRRIIYSIINKSLNLKDSGRYIIFYSRGNIEKVSEKELKEEAVRIISESLN